jgi:hypothetical protein
MSPVENTADGDEAVEDFAIQLSTTQPMPWLVWICHHV